MADQSQFTYTLQVAPLTGAVITTLAKHYPEADIRCREHDKIIISYLSEQMIFYSNFSNHLIALKKIKQIFPLEYLIYNLSIFQYAFFWKYVERK